LGRTAGPYAGLGRSPAGARSQDPDALSSRQAEGGPMSARASKRLWLLVGGALAALLAANAHLLYVAMTSHPPCVTHVRQGEGSVDRGLFSAAQSSCTPHRQGDRS